MNFSRDALVRGVPGSGVTHCHEWTGKVVAPPSWGSPGRVYVHWHDRANSDNKAIARTPVLGHWPHQLQSMKQ